MKLLDGSIWERVEDYDARCERERLERLERKRETWAQLGERWARISAETFIYSLAACVLFPPLPFALWFIAVFIWAPFDGGLALFSFHWALQRFATDVGVTGMIGFVVFIGVTSIVGGRMILAHIMKIGVQRFHYSRWPF